MKRVAFKPVRRADRMLSYWAREWKVVAAIVLSGTLCNGCMSLGPVLQGRVIDLLAAGGTGAAIWRAVGVYALAIALIQLARFCKRYTVRMFTNRTGVTMRREVYARLLRRPMAELEHERAGDLMTRVVSDVNACTFGMRKLTTETFDTGVLMIGYLATMLAQDARLTLIACACVPLAMFAAARMKTVIYRCTKAYRTQLSLVGELTVESVEHATLYRVTGTEALHRERYEGQLAALERRAVLANVLEGSMESIYRVVALLGLIALVLIGGRKVVDGAWTLGGFSAYVTIFVAFATRASHAAKLFNTLQKARVSWTRVKPYLGELPSETGRALPDASPYALAIEHLRFAYPGEESPVLTDVCLTARAGQLIGVTGPVASGKSTLATVLQGFYGYQGSVTLNGVELRALSAAAVAACVAVTAHDPQLLSDSIENNIRLGDDGDMDAVLRDVCFDKDLRAMPDGVRTMVGASGVRLSGGQQARLSLARALHRGAPVLVLDDPFAAVDVPTEKRILRNLRERYADRLILLISHRVSCFDQTDAVLLLDHGASVLAPHKQLLESAPVYRALFEAQEEVKPDA